MRARAPAYARPGIALDGPHAFQTRAATAPASAHVRRRVPIPRQAPAPASARSHKRLPSAEFKYFLDCMKEALRLESPGFPIDAGNGRARWIMARRERSMSRVRPAWVIRSIPVSHHNGPVFVRRKSFLANLSQWTRHRATRLFRANRGNALSTTGELSPRASPFGKATAVPSSVTFRPFSSTILLDSNWSKAIALAPAVDAD